MSMQYVMVCALITSIVFVSGSQAAQPPHAKQQGRPAFAGQKGPPPHALAKGLHKEDDDDVIPTWTLGGDATLLGSEDPAVILVSDCDQGAGYSSVELALPEGTMFSDLTELSADYRVLAGGIGGGSPRFQITLDRDANGDGYKDNVFVYLGDAPNYYDAGSGQWVSSGNLIPTADSEGNLYFDLSQVGGTFYGSYEEALALVGEEDILKISLVVDSCWLFEDPQIVLVDNVTVVAGDEEYVLDASELAAGD